jgi:hypothetical protein
MDTQRETLTLTHTKNHDNFTNEVSLLKKGKESIIKIRAVAIEGTLGAIQFRNVRLSVSHPKLRRRWVRSPASCR